MDFLQSLRVSQLSEQFTHWANKTNVDKLYKGLDRRQTTQRMITDDFVVQKWSDGYITVEDGTLKYEDLNTGKTFVLRKNYNEVDHTCYAALHDAAGTSFRCSKLDYREVVVFGSTKLEYLEFSAPTGEYGSNFVTDVFFNEVSDIGTYLKDRIYEIKQLASLAKKIAEENNAGFPDFSLILFDSWIDSKGAYWQELLGWNYDYQESMESTLMFLDNFLGEQVARGTLDSDQAASIKEYARTSWL
jgi:hypothetical protein